jgi:DNA-binding transcriptional regulator YdaS (Cro superfamily)
MKLHEYLTSEGALSVGQLARLIGVKNDAQVRQWQHGYAGRVPSPEYCVAIERVTNKQVRRWDLRPKDWWLIWPELIDTEGAPAIGQDAPEPEPNGA